MENKQSEGRRSGKVLRNTVVIALAVIVLLLVVCAIFGIHLFTLGMGGKNVDRIDRIDGYYVAVYGNDVRHYWENGEDCLWFGSAGNEGDPDWSHREVLFVEPYRRFLCFSKSVEEETYYLTDASGTVRYGIMYVLRTSGDTIHYYYRRDCLDSNTKYSPLLFNEKITFSYGGEAYDLEKFCFFTADVDFTTNEHVLLIEGEPCYFKSLEAVIQG